MNGQTVLNRRSLLGLAAGAAIAPLARAQSWPEGPIRLLLPVSPGSAVDSIARKLAPLLATSLGQPFVIENRPGAGGTVAAGQLVRSAPDGQTLSVVSSTYCVAPHLYKLPFDAMKEIQPVALLSSGPLVLVVHPKVPATNLQQLLALAKSRPEGESITFGNAGNGTTGQFAAAQLAIKAGVPITQVAYKGTSTYTTDLLGGQIDGGFLPPGVAMPFLRDGRLRAIGLSTTNRLPMFPDVPTLAEAGIKGYDVDGWMALVAPSKVPKPIIARLNAEVARALKDPDFRKFVTDGGGALTVTSVAETEKLFADEYAEAGRVIKHLGIRAE